MNGQPELATATEPLEVSTAQHAETVPPIDYFQLAVKYKWWLAAGFLGGLFLGIAIYLKLGPAYEATTRILVSKKVSMPIRDGETATYGERGQHIALIMSPFIVGKAVQSHQLDRLPSLAKSKDPVEDILDSLVVKRSAGHDQSFINIIDISCRNPNKQDAQAIVSAIVDAYRSYLSESTEEHIGEVVELITKANKELLQQLREKEREYLAFRESAPLRWRTPPGAETTPNDVTNIHLETLEAIEAEQRRNLLKRTALESQIKTLEAAAASGHSRRSLELLARLLIANSGRGGVGSPAVTPTAGGLETQLVPLLTERQKLLRDYGPDHPRVQAVQESIETVIAFYRSRGVVVPEGLLEESQPQGKPGQTSRHQDGLFAAYLQSLRQQLAELEYRDKQLAELHARESKLAKELARYQAQDQTFHDDIARIKALWNVVVRRLNELNLIKNSQGYTLKQIAPVRV
ncbi:MAG TPA: hypothetical protein EYP14_05500, partial [Planctomycetaceae bacterium]|nr:hypothetical protein [Planctomycetaceae bacterium]